MFKVFKFTEAYVSWWKWLAHFETDIIQSTTNSSSVSTQYSCFHKRNCSPSETNIISSYNAPYMYTSSNRNEYNHWPVWWTLFDRYQNILKSVISLFHIYYGYHQIQSAWTNASHHNFVIVTSIANWTSPLHPADIYRLSEKRGRHVWSLIVDIALQ